MTSNIQTMTSTSTTLQVGSHRQSLEKNETSAAGFYFSLNSMKKLLTNRVSRAFTVSESEVFFAEWLIALHRKNRQ
jgi:hypothetical protein